jgi:MoaA/NifB/PqqE/SkfB family radical SAM enzyme
MYLSIDQIKTIQLDHTSRCNLACSQCARTGNKNLPMLDLTVQDYQRILEPFEPSTIDLFHCGNYGDVIASPTFDDTLDYCLNQGITRIRISTNGSARRPSWWQELARKLGPQSTVTFAIDGLENTNHIYRTNSRWSIIKNNIESFIRAGGRARWHYIVFDHNIDDLESAQRYATDIGVERFSIKNSSRFVTSSGYDKKLLTVLPEPNNQNINDHEQIVKLWGSFDRYVSSTQITCKYQQQRTIYVDFDTRVWPCCWVGAPLFFDNDTPQRQSIMSLLNKYEDDFNKLNTHSWNQILNHEFFRTELESSWNNSTDDTEYPRLYTCGRTCGNKYQFSSGYGHNINTVILNENKT